MDIMYVVGDGFIGFLQNKNTISISTFEAAIHSKSILNETLYIIGQGVSEEQISSIKLLAKREEMKNIYIKGENLSKEQGRYVHKIRSENVMIAVPSKINDELYMSSLMVDDDCAEMSDHTTGQHVQGMVIIEAARQMMLSVSERFLVEKEARFNSYFILQNMDIKFKKFVFPISVEIRCQLVEYEKIAGNKFKAKMYIDFLQNDSVCAHTVFEFMADEKYTLQHKEARLADLNLQAAYTKELRSINNVAVLAYN